MNGQAVTVANTRGRKLVYTPEFKGFVRANPGFVKFFRDSHRSGKDLASRGNEVERIRNGGFVNRGTWRVKYGTGHFFVKESPLVYSDVFFSHGFSHKSWKPSGPDEFLALAELERGTSRGIRVVKHLVAFSDGRTSFIVTDFCSLPKLEDSRDVPEPLMKEFERFINWAKKRLIIDVNSGNAFYDKKTETVIVFDPMRVTAEWLRERGSG
jgi:hypothetical protein